MKKSLTALLVSAASLFLFAGGPSDGALKYFELRNDIAVAILSGDEDTVEKAVKRASSFREKIKYDIVRCETCKGKKPFIVTEPDHGQNAGRIKKSEMLGQHKVICPICKGRGRLRVCKPVDLLEKEFSSALRIYEAKNLSEGLIKTNGAFFASAQLEKVTASQMEAVALIMGYPCRRCKATGASECRKCKGDGTVECRNSGCREGWFKTQRKNTSKTKYPPTFKLCPECRATEKILCPECEGSRARICRDCGGEGFTQKKR